MACFLSVLLFVFALATPAVAQTCQTIFLPNNKVVICCTAGSVTTCY